MTVGLGTGLQSHAQYLSRVVWRAAHLRYVPVGSKVLRAHLRVRLETTTREYHCPGFDLLSPFGAFARHPDHSPRVVPQKAGHLTPVTELVCRLLLEKKKKK